MTDVIASEFLKVRSVRSSYAVLAVLGGLLVIGTIMVIGMTVDFDHSSMEQRSHFEAADASSIVIPFSQFCIAAFGALAITSEFGTGMIRPSLVAVPQRKAMIAGKVAVVGALALVVGQVVAFAAYLVSRLIAGGHPAPLWRYESTSDGVRMALSNGVSIMVLALVGLGVGLLVRSTAGALVTVVGLLLILPTMTFLLPNPWSQRVSLVMLVNLAGQLSGNADTGAMSPIWAAVVMAVWVLTALGAGAVAFVRRDP